MGCGAEVQPDPLAPMVVIVDTTSAGGAVDISTPAGLSVMLPAPDPPAESTVPAIARAAPNVTQIIDADGSNLTEVG